MIQPLEDGKPSPLPARGYETVLCTELPAFDPLPTLKSVLLSPPRLRRFNDFLRRIGPITMPIYMCAVITRILVCVCPVDIGRRIAPWSALLHIPPCIVFAAGIRVEFAKLILLTFDLWFPLAANTIFMVVFSIVLRDSRVLVVVGCWLAFGNSFLQETYFRDSRQIALSALNEAFLLVLLMGGISLELMPEVHHTDLIVAGGHSLSTKDVLVNAIGTLATLMMRTMYRRMRLIQRQKKTKSTVVQSLGYRCTVALSAVGPTASARNSVVPQPFGPMILFAHKSHLLRKMTLKATKRGFSARHVSSRHRLPPLQIHLVKDRRLYDPADTIFPRIGTLEPLAKWQAFLLQCCGVTGFVLTIPSIFIPPAQSHYGVQVMAYTTIVTTAIYCLFHAGCSQRILYKRVISSFDYLFLIVQLLAAHLCLCDLFSWRWSSTCGVASSFIWTQRTLAVDALTPCMRRRLNFQPWMPTCGIMLFMIVQLLVLLDMMVWDFSEVRDRVFWDLHFLGKQAEFRVMTFLWSRLVTICIWYSRLFYILLTRTHNNALIMLRGNVEFDYMAWRQRAKFLIDFGGESARSTRAVRTAVVMPRTESRGK